MRFRSFGTMVLAFGLSSPHVRACETGSMATTDVGFVQKVVARSNQIVAYAGPDEGEVVFELELLQPYFVICEAGDYYRVTDLDALTVAEALAGNTGFVQIDQVAQWTTREALSFSDFAFLGGRSEIRAWHSEEDILDFMSSEGNIRLHPPTFQENLEATLRRERAVRPYPVLGSAEGELRSSTARYYEVLLPAAIPPGEGRVVMEGDDFEAAAEVLTSATILIVFDATGSMAAVAQEVARAMVEALESLPQSVRDGTRVGFVFFRDEGDSEPMVVAQPEPIDVASDLLLEASRRMDGGGDEAEPILDALYFGLNFYDWGQSGRRIMIGVLNGDAKERTLGTIDPAQRVPPGLDVFQVARDLADSLIPVITVQAGSSAGPMLEMTLDTLARDTGGRFIEYGSGLDTAAIAEGMTTAMLSVAEESIAEGRSAIGDVVFDFNAFASIPLEILDAEQMERMRRAGVDFNIELNEGGVLIEEGYMLENADLLTPVFQLEKETLVDLINLYSVMGTRSLDAGELRGAVSEAISAIAGEDFDPDQTIEEIVSKQLGVEFRSHLLSFPIQYFEAMVPEERLKLQGRLQDAATRLSNYLDANLEEFDTLPAVWMPVGALP